MCTSNRRDSWPSAAFKYDRLPAEDWCCSLDFGVHWFGVWSAGELYVCGLARVYLWSKAAVSTYDPWWKKEEYVEAEDVINDWVPCWDEFFLLCLYNLLVFLIMTSLLWLPSVDVIRLLPTHFCFCCYLFVIIWGRSVVLWEGTWLHCHVGAEIALNGRGGGAVVEVVPAWSRVTMMSMGVL